MAAVCAIDSSVISFISQKKNSIFTTGIFFFVRRTIQHRCPAVELGAYQGGLSYRARTAKRLAAKRSE